MLNFKDQIYRVIFVKLIYTRDLFKPRHRSHPMLQLFYESVILCLLATAWAKFIVSMHLFMGIGRICTLAVTRDVVGGSCAAADFTVAQAGTLYRIRHAHVFAKRHQTVRGNENM